MLLTTGTAPDGHALALEDVVAKHRDCPYLPGRRTRTWIKHKLRRDERLTVTGLRRTPAVTVEAIFVSRRHPDGSFTGAGSIELGLQRERVERLEARLAELPARRRGAVAWCPGRVARRANNIAVGRAPGHSGFWRWLWK